MAEPVWKPVAAGLLVVVAVAMVGRNLVGPGLREDEPFPTEPAATESVSGSPAPTMDSVATDSPSLVPPTAQSAPPSVPVADPDDTSHLSDWIPDPGRDPFGIDPRRASSAKTSEPRRDGSVAPARPPAAKHKLTAIAWGAGKLALVDGIPVGIGDSLPGGRVVDIRSDRLVLRRGASDTLLRFWEGRTP